MGKLRKTGYFIGNDVVASNSLSVVGGDLVSINANGFAVKSTVAATTPVIEGVVAGEQTFASNNQTVDKAKVNYAVKNDELRVELASDADLTQAMINDKFDINASQVVVTGAAGTQVQLTKIIDTRVGEFKIL
jgi:membrane-bound inhibitor of C-type lysozyme